MGKGNLKSKNDRFSRLLGLLRSDEHWTTNTLAEEVEVSHRTLMRDLSELQEAGYPIETDRGRGGGIRLSGRWGIEKLNLSNKEAISLLLSLSVTEALTQTTNDLGAKDLKQKIANVFPEDQRKNIAELRKRILIGKTASTEVLTNFTKASDLVWNDVMSSFFETEKIQIKYVDEKKVETNRDFDPHFLLLNWPVWYLLGWDYLRDDVRVFRVDRIKKVTSKSEPIARRPRSIFLEAYEAYFKNI
jgi:predicted DNA-binding transcriptional regulator YafY